ncbi:MAG TPA: trypsin-like peptidase domain-containing protein [Polyangia bacterium]
MIATLVTVISCGAGGDSSRASSTAASPPRAPALANQSPSNARDAAITPKTETPAAARSLSAAFAATAKAVRPSVVRIDVQRAAPRLARGPRPSTPERNFFGQLPPLFERFFIEPGETPDFPQGPPAQAGTGSGFLIDVTGNILTNSHVVEGGQAFQVTLHDGRKLNAKVIGKDRRTDVAVIRLEQPPKDLVAARLGDSSKLEIAEWVLAVGSPLGMEQTVTAGIVSSKGRVGRNVQMSGDRVREYIQTDAKINPGNSGGPLVNLDGEVVGVNTLIRVGAGGAYGFAVPINEAHRVAQVLLREGRVKYPFLGTSLRSVADLDPETKSQLASGAPATGALVAEVSPGSPAAKAGVRAGDVITRIDDRPVNEAGDVVDHVSSRGIGQDVNVELWRAGGQKRLRATLAEAPTDPDEPSEAASLGLALQTLSPSLAESLGLAPNTRGVVVAEVNPGSPAAAAGLEPGDVIVEIDKQPVSTSEQAADLLKRQREGGHLLRVRGPSGSRFVTLGR